MLDDVFVFHENTFYLTVKSSDCGCVSITVSAMLVMSIRYQHIYGYTFLGLFFFSTFGRKVKNIQLAVVAETTALDWRKL